MAEHELNKIVDDEGEVFNVRDSTKQPVADRATSWSGTPSDTKYPSEKLVKTSLDGKQNSLPTTGTASASYAINITGNAATASAAQSGSALETAINNKISKSGDTMTGRLTLGKPLSQVITGTGTAASTSGSTYYPAKWNFDLGIATPTAGDQLVIKLPVAGSDYGTYISTDNGTTYFPVACNVGTSRLTTRYPSGAYICVVFEAYVSGSSGSGQVNDIYPLAGGTARTNLTTGCWRVINDYDSGNTICQIRTENGRFYAGSTGCKPYALVCLDKAGKYSMLVSSGSGTGTSKTINTAGKFKLNPVILYYSANNTTAANALVSSTYATFIAHQSVDTRYSHNYTTAFTTNSPLYIECTIDEDGYWSPTTKCITQTLTTGNYYIYLGQTYSTAYQVSLSPAHPVYYYDGTNLTEVPRLSKADRTKLDGIASGATKVEASSTNGKVKINGTDTTVYTHPTQTSYSAKGSATKVPKITTDSTGHVTSIEEVTISGVTPASHTHGNIHNDGTIVGGNDGSGKTVANNDRLVVAESTSTGYKAVLTTTSFDGSTTTKALTPKGTFESFAKAGDITAAIQALDVSSVGGSGKYISAISEADGKISATATSMDTAPTASSTNAVTSGGVKTALDGKQDDVKYQLVEYGTLQYSDVAAIISAGKVPVVYSDNSLYVCDGTAYTVNDVNEYRFTKASGNVESPRIIYIRLRDDSSGWGGGVVSLASNSALSTKADASVVTALSTNVANHNTWFHVETLHITDNITQFLKMSFSGRVGRASALVSIGGNNGNDSSAFRLSWFYDPAATPGNISNLGRELFSTGSIGKRPLIYYDSNSFYIGLSAAGPWGATIAVMLACENPEYVTYSTVTRSVATGSGKTALPLEWFAVYSKTINVLDTSGTVGTDSSVLYFT